MKQCRTCKREQPLDEFYIHRGASRKSECKSCYSERSRKNYDPVRNRVRVYGISETEAQRLLAIENCQICGRHDDTAGALYIDHDHATGKVRGVLCNGCNTGLGAFRDDVDSLTAAVAYLSHSFPQPLKEVQ